MVGPSDGELELLRQARDRAMRTREGWLAAQLGSLGKSLSDVAGDLHRQEIEAEVARAASASGPPASAGGLRAGGPAALRIPVCRDSERSVCHWPDRRPACLASLRCLGWLYLRHMDAGRPWQTCIKMFGGLGRCCEGPERLAVRRRPPMVQMC